MTPAPAHIWLGAATEALLAKVFADRLVINAKTCAGVIGVDEKTLRGMTEAGIIRARRRGRERGYGERDLRDYLEREESETQCPSTSRGKARSGTTTSSGKVYDFTARPGSRRGVRPSASRS
jgi:hypothetical protein